MAQLKTYSRKSKLTESFDGAYKSSQESFFDSPDDPYSFDSQQSSFELPQSKSAVSSQPQMASSPLEMTDPCKVLTQPVQAKRAAAPPLVQHTREPGTKLGPTGNLSRLSRSSSHETATQPKRTAQELPKRSCPEAPVSKKVCVQRSSGTSVNQVRRSGSKTVTDKQSSAPATTVLEVIHFSKSEE